MVANQENAPDGQTRQERDERPEPGTVGALRREFDNRIDFLTGREHTSARLATLQLEKALLDVQTSFLTDDAPFWYTERIMRVAYLRTLENERHELENLEDVAPWDKAIQLDTIRYIDDLIYACESLIADLESRSAPPAGMPDINWEDIDLDKREQLRHQLWQVIMHKPTAMTDSSTPQPSQAHQITPTSSDISPLPAASTSTTPTGAEGINQTSELLAQQERERTTWAERSIAEMQREGSGCAYQVSGKFSTKYAENAGGYATPFGWVENQNIRNGKKGAATQGYLFLGKSFGTVNNDIRSDTIKHEIQLDDHKDRHIMFVDSPSLDYRVQDYRKQDGSTFRIKSSSDHIVITFAMMLSRGYDAKVDANTTDLGEANIHQRNPTMYTRFFLTREVAAPLIEAIIDDPLKADALIKVSLAPDATIGPNIYEDIRRLPADQLLPVNLSGEDFPKLPSLKNAREAEIKQQLIPLSYDPPRKY